MATELLEHISEKDVLAANQESVKRTSVSPQSCARVLVFVISQPEDTDVKEVVFRPTLQEL